MVGSCFHPDRVSVELNSIYSPCGSMALTRPISMPDISENFPTHSLQAVGATSIRVRASGGSTYSTRPRNIHIPRDWQTGAPLLPVVMTVNQSMQRWVLGTNFQLTPWLEFPFQSRGERLHPEDCCIHFWELWLYGILSSFCPFYSWNQNPKSILSCLCCLCHSVQPMPSRVTDTSNLNSSPDVEMARALICCTSIFIL